MSSLQNKLWNDGISAARDTFPSERTGLKWQWPAGWRNGAALCGTKRSTMQDGDTEVSYEAYKKDSIGEIQ